MTQDQTEAGRRWHDMGGTPAGAVVQDVHDHALWEKRVDALKEIAGARGLFTVDGLRRVLEDMGPESFAAMSYYERWMKAIAENLVQSGVITVAELNARMDQIAQRADSYGDAQDPTR